MLPVLTPLHCRTGEHRLIGLQLVDRLSQLLALFRDPWRSADRLHAANPERPWLRTLLAAAESLAINSGLFSIGLDASNRRSACGQRPACASSTPALCSDAALRRPWSMLAPSQWLRSGSWADQASAQVRLAQIGAIKPCSSQVGALKGRPFRLLKRRLALRRSAPSSGPCRGWPVADQLR